MMNVKALRSAVGVAQVVALMTALALLCPCPGAPGVGPGHGCCASAGLSAATSCCSTTPGQDAMSPTPLVGAPLGPAPAGAPAVIASAIPAPVLGRVSLHPSAPALVLRI